MSEKYIRIQDAVDALAKTMPTLATPDGAGEFDHEIHIADEAFADAIRIIESLEPADVVQVVRCENCVHWSDSNQCARPELSGSRWHDAKYFETMPDDFCSYGERREG